MRTVINRIFSLMDWLAKLICGLCAFGFFAVILYQVICRFFLNISVNWSDEVCRYLFFVMVFVGSVLCVNEKGHFSIDIASALLPRKVQDVLVFVVHAISILFLIFLVRSGLILSAKTVAQSSADLGIPLSKLYLVMPVCAVFMILYTVRVAVEDFFHIHSRNLAERGASQ